MTLAAVKLKLKATCKKQGAHWLVTLGGYSVKVYQGDVNGQPAFTIAYLSSSGRKREMRRTFEDAKVRAEAIAKDFVNGTPQNAELKPGDRVLYARAQRAVEALGIPLDVAAIQLAELQKQLGACSLSDAVQYYAKRHPTGATKHSVSDVRQAFLAARRADGSGEEHMRDLEIRTARFSRSFQCPIANVSTQDISAWLRGLSLSGRSRNNFRAVIRNMFRFAAAQNWVAQDHINWETDNGVATAKEEDGAIEIFTPDEIRKLIAGARYESPAPRTRKLYIERQGLLPFLILGAFAGLRTSEICAQQWEDINLERGFIRVSKVKGNTPAKRLVPLTDNCKAWLQVCRRNGKGCIDYGRLDGAIRELSERSKVPWKKNALRHSFISYRVAETMNIPQVAIEAGNSPRMIFDHYRELVTPEEAKAWFAIRPEAPANVGQMPATAK